MSRGSKRNLCQLSAACLENVMLFTRGNRWNIWSWYRNSCQKFQTKYGLSQTGAVDTTTWDTLKSKILEVEQKLSSLNYSPGKVDGIATAGTGESSF